jgi:hypothetical protein
VDRLVGRGPDEKCLNLPTLPLSLANAKRPQLPTAGAKRPHFSQRLAVTADAA